MHNAMNLVPLCGILFSFVVGYVAVLNKREIRARNALEVQAASAAKPAETVPARLAYKPGQQQQHRYSQGDTTRELGSPALAK